jgi:hypothetical protein
LKPCPFQTSNIGEEKAPAEAGAEVETLFV